MDYVEKEYKPVITVSGFPHNMQSWYEEKLTIAKNALTLLESAIHRLDDAQKTGCPSKQDEIYDYLHTAMCYIDTIMKVSCYYNPIDSFTVKTVADGQEKELEK